ncbi:MAG: hypothetical protein C6I01_01860 [Epsilonproteobacteria bacterium]|nr:hypothetical protein [Campylobacterota bacterium]
MAVNRNFVQNYFIGGGQLYVSLDGVWKYFGQTESVQISFSTDKVEHNNSEGEVIVPDLQLTKSIKGEVTIETADLNPQTLALAFMGEYEESRQSAQTGLSVSVTPIGGGVYPLGYAGVKNVEVKDSDGNVAVEGVDYSVIYPNGLIEFATDSSFVGKDLTITFDVEEKVIREFKALNQTSREVGLMFIAEPLHGKREGFEIFRTILSLDGEYSLKSPEDVKKITLKGQVLADLNRPVGEQYFRRWEIE